MALTAQEQAEMDQLEKEVGHLDQSKPQVQASASRLTPEEQAEMDQLQKEVGHLDQPVNAPGSAQTALEHGANAVTFGYLPQLQAMAEPLTTKIGNLVTGQNVEPDSYVTARDKNVKRLSAESQANPKSATAGDIGGSVVGALATPVPGLGTAGGILGGAAKGAVYGGAQGLLQNPGDKPGVVDPLQLSERGSGALSGALVGAATGGATEAARKGIGALAGLGKSLQETANTAAFKGSGAMLKDFRAAGDKTGRGVQDIGKFMLDNGLIKAGDTVEDVAKKAEQFRKAAGNRLDDIYESANRQNARLPNQKAYQANSEKVAADLTEQTGKYFYGPLGPDNRLLDPMGKETEAVISGANAPKEFLTSIDKGWVPSEGDRIIELPTGGKQITGLQPARDKQEILSAASKAMGNQEGKARALKRLGAYLDQVASDAGDRTLSPREAQDVKTEIDKVINYSRNPLSKKPASESAFSAARKLISDKIDGEIERLGGVSGSDKLGELKAANRDYGLAKQVEQIAKDKLSRESANRAVSLTDTIAGGAGGIAGTIAAQSMGGDHDPQAMGEGALMGGLLAGAANHYGKKYGPGLIADTANRAAPAAGLLRPLGRLSGLVPRNDIAVRAAVNSRRSKNDE